MIALRAVGPGIFDVTTAREAYALRHTATQESNQDLNKEDQIPIIGYQIPYAKHNTPHHCNPFDPERS
jgi:hypothetical protein